MSLFRYSCRIRRAAGLVIACLFAFAGIAHAAKACPVGQRNCLAVRVAALEVGDEHHADQPCAMKSAQSERSGAATATADTPGPALPVALALIVAVADAWTPVKPFVRPPAPRRILDIYGRLRL